MIHCGSFSHPYYYFNYSHPPSVFISFLFPKKPTAFLFPLIYNSENAASKSQKPPNKISNIRQEKHHSKLFVRVVYVTLKFYSWFLLKPQKLKVSFYCWIHYELQKQDIETSGLDRPVSEVYNVFIWRWIFSPWSLAFIVSKGIMKLSSGNTKSSTHLFCL